MTRGNRVRLNESGADYLADQFGLPVATGETGTVTGVLQRGCMVLMDNPALRSAVTEAGAIYLAAYDVMGVKG